MQSETELKRVSGRETSALLRSKEEVLRSDGGGGVLERTNAAKSLSVWRRSEKGQIRPGLKRTPAKSGKEVQHNFLFCCKYLVEWMSIVCKCRVTTEGGTPEMEIF